MDQTSESGFYGLPEGCIADVLSLTTPRDACQLALVAKLFNSAAESDVVWDKFLPPDYRNIIESAINPSSFPDFSSTKDLYLHLSDHPLIIDGGNKSFSLEKRSGKKCYMLAARTLTIAWGETPHYWTWTPFPDARFEEVAELQLVWWLHIHGNLSTSLLSPNTNYAAYLVYKLTNHASGFDFSYYDHGPEVFVGRIGEENNVQFANLAPESLRRSFNQTASLRQVTDMHVTCPKERKDGWLEVELGEFYNNSEGDEELIMSLKEVKTCKRGLIIQGIEIRPKEG